jgi:hypothetical protein
MGRHWKQAKALDEKSPGELVSLLVSAALNTRRGAGWSSA